MERSVVCFPPVNAWEPNVSKAVEPPRATHHPVQLHTWDHLVHKVKGASTSQLQMPTLERRQRRTVPSNRASRRQLPIQSGGKVEGCMKKSLELYEMALGTGICDAVRRGTHRGWKHGRGSLSRASRGIGTELPLQAHEKSSSQIRWRAPVDRVARTRTAMSSNSSKVVRGGGELSRPCSV